MEKRIDYEPLVTELVKDYLQDFGHMYIENYERFGEYEKNHVVNIGTQIMLNYWGLQKYEPGSFVKSFISNNLHDSYMRADRINSLCIRFYLMMKYNLRQNF